MRIVAGRHRGRVLAPVPEDLAGALRPTADRARQALFDILTHALIRPDGTSRLMGAVVLDAFCGSGALALEALSRGAAQATLMDISAAALALAARNAETLKETQRVTLIRTDAKEPPQAPIGRAADLVFLDPPYGTGRAVPALAALAARGWIAASALVVIETAAAESLDLPALASLDLTPLTERVYGAARIRLFQCNATN